MSNPADAAPDGLSFGQALGELEKIVASLEGGQLELEESLATYERGVGLLRTLQDRLAEAQLKVAELLGELESEAGRASEGEEESASSPANPDLETEVPF